MKLQRLISSGYLSERFSGSDNLAMIFTRASTPKELSIYFKNILSLIASGDEKLADDQGSISVSQNILNEFIYRVFLSLNRLE